MLRCITILLFVVGIGFCSRASTFSICHQCELSSLAMAIDQTSSGDTLIFKAGTYSSPGIEIRKPLTLIGEPGALLDGEAKNYILKILADSVTVQGFALINSGRSYTKDYAAIYIHRSIAFALINNTVKDSFFGFLIEKSSNGRVHGNKIIGTATREDQSGNGVHLWDCDSILISENEVSGMRDGIYLEFVDGSEIIENYSHHNVRYGLHFMFSNHDRYTRNTFERNGAGVAVMFSKYCKDKI